MSNYFNQRFAALLSITQTNDAQQLARRVGLRLAGMGYTEPCWGCKGTGKYAANTFGSKCFTCQGAGVRAARLCDALYAQVKADVAAGKLAAYLETVRQRIAAKEAAKQVERDRIGSGYLRTNRRQQNRAAQPIAA